MSRLMGLLGLDRRDIRLYLRVCAATLFFLVVLYGVPYLTMPPGYEFSGFLHNAQDLHSYRVWANTFAHQGLLADNPWGSLDRQPGRYFNLVWWAFGGLMTLGAPFMAAYHFFHAGSVALMLLMLLALMRELVRDRVMAWTAWLLATFGTGFSWIAFLAGKDFRPTFLAGDILHGDSFPANVLWTAPHIALAYAMVAAIYLCVLRAASCRDRRWVVGAVLVALPLGFVHPYHFVVILPVLACWSLIRHLKHGREEGLRAWSDLAIVAAGMLPGLLFYWNFVHAGYPNFAHWESGNTIRTAGWLQVVLGFGCIILLAFVGYRGIAPVGRFTDRYLFVAVWASVNFAMQFTYPFIFFELKLGAGLIIPLAILASWGFFGSVLPFFRRDLGDPGIDAEIMNNHLHAGTAADTSPPERTRWRIAVAVLVALCLPTSFFHMGNILRELYDVPPWFYFTQNTKMKVRTGELEAMRRLGEVARDCPMVMADFEAGLLLPGYAHVRTFIGHTSMTMDFDTRKGYVQYFFGPGGSDEARRGFLRDFRVDYVWWGIDEDAFGGVRPQDVPYLVPLFDNKIVTVYWVDRDRL